MSDAAPGTPPYPMPTRVPSFREAAEVEGLSASCPRHGLLSPYTRNTEGMYASATPPCCGPDDDCYEGIADELSNACHALRILLTDCDVHTTPANFLRDTDGIPSRFYQRMRRLRHLLAEHNPAHPQITQFTSVDCQFHICQHLEQYISNFNDPAAWGEDENRLGERGNPASLLRAAIARTGASRYARDTYIYRLAINKLTATG